jgi:hypothetical protein
MQRRLAVTGGGERNARHRRLQFAKIIDLTIRNQSRGPREQRLIPGREIDDGEPVMRQPDAADHGLAGAIGAAMRDRRGQSLQHRGIGQGRVGGGDQAGNATHQARATSGRTGNCICDPL